MRKNIGKLLAVRLLCVLMLVVSGGLMYGCEGDVDDPIVPSDEETLIISKENQMFSLDYQDTVISIEFEATEGWKTTLIADSAWLSLSQYNGEAGNVSVTVDVDENITEINNLMDRTARLVIYTDEDRVTVDIVQNSGFVPEISLVFAPMDTNVWFDGNADTLSIQFSAYESWEAEVYADSAWVSVSPSSGGEGQQFFDVIVDDYLTIGDTSVVRMAQVRVMTAKDTVNISLSQTPVFDYELWGFELPMGEMFGYNRNYEWYIDQNNTGEWSNINCGPSCATMALMWADSTFDKTAEDARNAIRPEGEWWYTYDVENYICDNGAYAKYYDYSSKEILKEFIDEGGLAILCMDVSYVTHNDIMVQHVDRYYPAGEDSGHFIVVKGYKYSNGKLYYEAYDPWSIGRKYENGEYKGKDRYYSADDLHEAVEVWWTSMKFIGVTRTSTGGAVSKRFRSVRRDEIEHVWGGRMN